MIGATTLSLLRVLSDGEFHSGADMGKQSNVSRAAVWKQLQPLIERGLSIESVKGKGYRLVGGCELLDWQTINDALTFDVDALLPSIEILPEIDSTNNKAMNYARNEEKGRAYVCLAEYQSAGKGRRGRQWFSPFAHNIYLSVAWPFQAGVNQLDGLSLAIGLMVAKSLKSMGLEKASLKWPNDLLLGGKKLGGVLLEVTGDMTDQCWLIAGIGLNVETIPEDVVDQPCAAIKEKLPTCSRNQIVAELLNYLIPMLQNYPVKGFAPYKEEWESLDAYNNQLVNVHLANDIVAGVARGITEHGELKVDVDGHERIFNGGEVSLRADTSY